MAWLGGGFCLGILVCAILVKASGLFVSRKLKTLSEQALFDNSSRFMALADQYFSSYVKEARKDFDIKGDELLRTIDPVKQTLDRYETRLNIMEKDRENAFGSITERLLEVGRTQNMLHVETGNLVKALRVPHVRGRWGELTLKRVAELAGMSEYCDFSQQVAVGSGKGSGKGSIRPDMVVTLPGNRKIIIDAKVPLMAYLDALEAQDESEREARMKDHGRQIMKHISDLSSKQYFDQISPTPEFTVLFIPGENFFSAALTVYPDLIEKGIEQGVVLATPTTLIALLKAVSYSWKQQKGYENAQEIQDLGKEIFTRLCSMTENFNRLGKDIEKCVSTYNRTIGAMETRVMSTAKKLENLVFSSQSMDNLEPIDELNARPREFNRQNTDEQ
ncbi:MAG: DNA recombination protein RmuC [Pseudomonadota bacterium]